MKNQFNDEIDLIQILKKFYNAKNLIFYISTIFVITGVIVALLSPLKYSSSTIFITQSQESGNSSLSGVANLVGINLGASSYGGEIPPSMYPKVGNSTRFKRLMLDTTIDNENNFTLKDFLLDYYELENEDKLNSSYLYVSKIDEKCFQILDEIISISVNQKDRFITISSTMPVAEYSAIVAKMSREILQSIIIENKIETARQNLKFSEKQLTEKKFEFDEIQSKLAYFSDSNLNTVNSFVKNEKDKLEAEFEIISAVVTELSKQVEQAKLQVSKDTPVFSTIEEAVIPNTRISPKRTQLVIFYGFVGFVLSCFIVLIQEPLKKIILEIISK